MSKVLNAAELEIVKQAYVCGHDAAQRGLSNNQNPHEWGSISYRAWNNGHYSWELNKHIRQEDKQ